MGHLCNRQLAKAMPVLPPKIPIAMLQTIFVPTDFSACSLNAVRAAGVMARKMKASLYLFHTISTPADWLKLSMAEEAKYPESRERIAHARQQLQALAQSPMLEGIDVRQSLHFNETLMEALEGAKCLPTDLVVMGTHGTSTLSRLLLGSNAQKVVRLAKCPVLTINEHAQTFDIRRIVVAADFADEEDTAEGTLQLVLALERAFDAEVHLLQVEGLFPSKTFNAGAWEPLVAHNFAKKASISIDPFATVDEGVIKYAVDAEADLIVMASHGRTGLARFLMGSVAETVVNFSPIPVLVTHFPSLGERHGRMVGEMAQGLSNIR
jgi:nucleotide-binding universal stress UspA family protein